MIFAAASVIGPSPSVSRAGLGRKALTLADGPALEELQPVLLVDEVRHLPERLVVEVRLDLHRVPVDGDDFEVCRESARKFHGMGEGGPGVPLFGTRPSWRKQTITRLVH